MKLLVTGASGFLGRYVVAEALRRGHAVRAMLRPASDISALEWTEEAGVELVRADLRSTRQLTAAVAGVDAVLHLAATKSGDIYHQLSGTVVATENLLAAMDEAGLRHIVAISTLALYDYRRMRMFSLLDERARLEGRPEDRDAYCQTKLLQERLIREHAERHDWRWTVLRPGVIFGRDNLWTARLGVQVGPRVWLRTGAWSQLPLTYVENCADAVVMCAERDAALGQTFNVVDDDTPTQRRYAKLLQRRMTPPPRILPISWTILRAMATLASVTNQVAFAGRGQMPAILVPASLHARCKPLRYTNRHLCNSLGWRPRYSLAQALERCFHPDVDRVCARDRDSADSAIGTSRALAATAVPAIK